MINNIWETVIEEWRDWMKAASRPATTMRLRTYQLRRFAADHGHPWDPTQKTIITWLAGQNWSAESRRSYRSALRTFYTWAQASGYIDHNPAALIPPVKVNHHPPRPTPETILAQALLCAEPRVQLMILLAARQGLRRGEIARVHTEDLTEDLVGWSLRVHGKGNKERVIPLHTDIAGRLRDLPAGWAFPGEVDGHLSPRWVGSLVKSALGVEGWTTHTLRHRFATSAYHGSRDLLAVQGLLGHSKPETTQNYVQLPDDAMRSALRWAA